MGVAAIDVSIQIVIDAISVVVMMAVVVVGATKFTILSLWVSSIAIRSGSGGGCSSRY